MAMWARPYQTSWGPPPTSEICCPLGVWGGAGKLWIYITSAVWQLATRCLILGLGFPGQAIQWSHSRDRGSKGRCYGNQFCNYIRCKWTLTGDNDMMLSYKGWLVFSQRLRLLVAVSGIVVAAIGNAPGGGANLRLEIDTLIANILVYLFIYSFIHQSTSR